MIWLLAIASAFALEPVLRPSPATTEIRPDDCKDISAAITNEIVPCDGVLLSGNDLADLLADREWAFALEKQYRVDVAGLEWQVNWYKEQLKPVPFLQRPSTHVLLGVGGGMLMTIAGAWAIHEVGQL